jgi:hypothetical protein
MIGTRPTHGHSCLRVLATAVVIACLASAAKAAVSDVLGGDG